MFNSFLNTFSAFFVFVCLSFVCHTVSKGLFVLAQSHLESNSKITVFNAQNNDEQAKNGSQSNVVTSPPAKAVSFEVPPNVTMNKSLISDDPLFNSTATLPKWMMSIKEGALQRTGYVALGFMSIVMVFFVIRAVRLRQRRNKSRKYGLITSNVSDLEMEPLDREDEEEEDTTIFDAQHKYSLQ